MADPKIRVKRSAVEGKIPTPDQLPVGEVALNTFDGKFFASKNVGIGTTVFVVNPWSVGTGTNTYDTYFTSGNVGIGTTNPTKKLDIIGTAQITSLIVGSGATINGLTYPVTDGTNNQVLATNGSGVLQFLSISSLQAFDWESNSDFGLITESVTTSDDSGLITESIVSSYDLGLIATVGVVNPDQFILPSYTVSTLPAANPSGQMLFVTVETGGSVPAFSDGTNWRRVTDRAIVS